MSIKNVVIAGASGNLGPSILNAFTSSSSFNVSVLSRQESNATFPSGVKVLKADYSSVESLTSALKGQDAVVSVVQPHVQQNLIDASIAAGVKRFIPSEFGSNTASPDIIKLIPALNGKVESVKYLQTKGDAISYTAVITGAFFDWGIKVGFLGFDGKSKTATITNNGTSTFSVTNLRQIGLALIKILEKPEETKNTYVYVSSFETTQKEILAAVEKITGEKWTVKNVDAKDLLKQGNEKVQKGDYSGVVQQLQAATLGEGNLGDLRPAGLWNDKLGLQKASFEDSIKAALSGKNYGEN